MLPNDSIMIFSVVSPVGTAFPRVGHLIKMSGINLDDRKLGKECERLFCGRSS
jgi:hypothetical protein